MPNMSEAQRENVRWFYEHLQELLTDSLKRDKYAVVHEVQLKSLFDTFQNALKWAVDHLPLGEFVIQHVTDEGYYVSRWWSSNAR